MNPRIGSLFSGTGGLDDAVIEVLGGDVAWHSDIDPAARKLLAHHWPGVPNLGDVARIDWASVQPVDVITGGFPCQDMSHAGNRAGMKSGTRSGLWSHMATAIASLRPRLVVAENVRGLLDAPADSEMEPCPWCVGGAGEDHPLRALGRVLGDLADIGYDAAWCGLRAADVGAPHGRFRIFLLAWPADSKGDPGWLLDGDDASTPDSTGVGREGCRQAATWPIPEPAGRDRAALDDPDGLTSRRLLPTCTVEDMGQRKSVEGWDAWVARMRGSHGGNGHGASLSVEARRMRDTWGVYAEAIHHWEGIIGRPAPEPSVVGVQSGLPQLNPALSEWMMGLPEGRITGVPGLTRDHMRRLAGNGVVPQQAVAALRWLLDARSIQVGGAA